MVRSKIKASQLINRLQNYALAELTDESPGMTKGQVSAALGLLKKCVPDLMNTEMNAHLDGDLKQLVNVTFEWPK